MMIDMFNCFFLGLFSIFNGNTFGLMLLGILIGFIVGILPGMGAPAALAIMIPFSIKMQPFEAFAFLLGMIGMTDTTGDITSILFGVPGEATAAALILDGHAMAKKGEAGRALGANLMSSLVGAIAAGFVLATALPIIRPLVLTFRSPEFFMLTIVGLTFVTSLSGGDLLKGLLVGGVGLFTATVGLDPMTGIQRFTFGQLFLWDGIGIVPITIGFFAIPELIDLAVGGTSIAKGEMVGKLGGVMEGVKDSFRHFWLMIRCSFLAAYVALIPGIGGAITQWLAYAHAVQSSPDKERFGKGAVEGVIGPGAANNSTVGGSLTTTVAFGIPASVNMAILMGAFITQGIVPGPDMLIPEPIGHLTLTYSFVWTIIIANIIAVGVCFLFLKQLLKTTFIRGSLMIPFIILLIYIGAFAEKNVFEDLIVVVFFGLLGWVMVRLNWPRPPFILGVVLGHLAEIRLFLSTSNYGLAWLWRPSVLLIIALTLIGAFYPILKARRQKRMESKEQPPVPKPVSRNGTWPARFSWEVVFIFFIVVVFICALWESIMRFNFRAGLFPRAIGFSVLTLAIVQLIRELMGKGGKGVDIAESLAGAGGDLPTNVVNRRTAGILGWVIGYLVAIWLLGFSIGVPLCTFIQLKIGYREKWLLTLILTGFAWVFIYGLFDGILHIPFPPGQLFLWLKFPSM